MYRLITGNSTSSCHCLFVPQNLSITNKQNPEKGTRELGLKLAPPVEQKVGKEYWGWAENSKKGFRLTVLQHPSP